MKFKTSSLTGDEYELESTVNPIEDIKTIGKENRLIIYFFLDKFKFLKNGKTYFDAGDYSLKYEFGNVSNKIAFFYKFSYRLFALHYLIYQHFLPFKAIALLSKTKGMRYNLLKNGEFDKTFFLHHPKKWEDLKNDFPILEKLIKHNSKFESALIWHAFSGLAVTHSETFANLFKCIETLTREKYEEKISYPKVEAFLINLGCKKKTAQKLIDIRHKIAHGLSVEIEFNEKMIELKNYLYPLLENYFQKRIREMNIIGLKNEQFIADYVILENSQTKEEIMLEHDEWVKQRQDSYDRITDFMMSSRSRVENLAKQTGFSDDKVKYILHCYDCHHSLLHKNR